MKYLPVILIALHIAKYMLVEVIIYIIPYIIFLFWLCSSYKIENAKTLAP
jgi:hypothetical protein